MYYLRLAAVLICVSRATSVSALLGDAAGSFLATIHKFLSWSNKALAQTKTICWAQCSHREFISLRPLNSSHPLLSYGDQWPVISFGMNTPSVLRSKYAVHQNTECGRWSLGCTLKKEGRHECEARRGQDAALSKLCSDYAAGPTNAAFWQIT